MSYVKRIIDCGSCVGTGDDPISGDHYGLCRRCHGTGKICEIKNICEDCGIEYWYRVDTEFYLATKLCSKCHADSVLGWSPDEED